MSNKYHAKNTPCNNGHIHRSKREAKRCNELHLLQAGGVISFLEVEPQFWFADMKHDNGHRVGYKADFQYIENGIDVVEDVKGFSVRDWPLRKACFKHFYPQYELRVI